MLEFLLFLYTAIIKGTGRLGNRALSKE